MRLITALLFILISLNAVAAPEKTSALPKPKVIFFDVNETLLDLESMKQPVSTALGGRQDLLALWFSRMLHYSLVSVAIGQYKDFGSVGVAALKMVGEENGIKISDDQAKQAIVPALLSLKPHPDVKDGLKELKGYKLVTFTNSSPQGVSAQIKNAQLEGIFTRSLSTDEIKSFKPFLRTYEWALKEMNVKPSEALMVAAHGWDIAGAQAVGMQTAFISRKGQSLYPLSPKPTYVVQDVKELAQVLKK
ncbi:haloacid dehalogenase type II [Bdellovibrio sp. GT3]|uniref:haloacid dehalogenase type II n=1 Tax=Bdellovibrio sp. GT3 TaxID=3136282 RepID=UPI0030F2842F